MIGVWAGAHAVQLKDEVGARFVRAKAASRLGPPCRGRSGAEVVTDGKGVPCWGNARCGWRIGLEIVAWAYAV